MRTSRIIVTVGADGVEPTFVGRIRDGDWSVFGRADLRVGRSCDRARTSHAREIVLAPSGELANHPLCGGRDVADLYSSLRDATERLFLARCARDAFEHVCRCWRSGDTTCHVRVNGHAIEAVWRGEENPVGRLLPALPPERRIWIGLGTNTWRSDLNLNVAYRRTEGPADAPGATLGIPWMAGIPGTVGGWIKMNAGAFGHSISEALEAVLVDGVWRRAEDCGFSYRHSDIHGEIQDFRLRPPEAIRSEGTAEDYLKRRRKFPAGTFGSFFKNPPGDFAGRILESAGAKSLRVGGAHVWSEHANVIVSDPAATPSDVLALSRLMRARAFEASGIWLDTEVRGINSVCA